MPLVNSFAAGRNRGESAVRFAAASRGPERGAERRARAGYGARSSLGPRSAGHNPPSAERIATGERRHPRGGLLGGQNPPASRRSAVLTTEYATPSEATKPPKAHRRRTT